MRMLSSGGLTFSPTDLSNFLACRHKTRLEREAALKTRTKPHYNDPVAELLQQRGIEHERKYVEAQHSAGLSIEDLSDVEWNDRPEVIRRTLAAMTTGADLIVQGGLVSKDGLWYGRPDVLRRVMGTSAFGAWSYEALDTKLAQETTAATIVQLGCYSDLLEEMQAVRPEWFRVVTPVGEERYRVDDYAAYLRFVRREFDAAMGASSDTYPEPVAHCDVCVWRLECDDQRRADDHLSLVADIRRRQRDELRAHGVQTLTALGTTGLPVGFEPNHGRLGAYQRIAHQAALQVASRDKTPPEVFVLPVAPNQGLARLPQPSAGDVFLDLEGSQFACDGGREYLFGYATIGQGGDPTYESLWAMNDMDERLHFESVVDVLVARLAADPTMHIYHYNHYETTALKKLVGRYATRRLELDRLLSTERFIDLYPVVRQTLLAGIESYSIKSLEPITGFARQVALPDANVALRLIDHAFALNTPALIGESERTVVAGYNRDDCVSTWRLREWLEAARAGLIAAGTPVPRPGEAITEDEEAKAPGDLEQRVAVLQPQLLAKGDEPHRLLAYLIDWHKREWNASWWEFYRLAALDEDDLFDERKAVAGLVFKERIGEKTHATTRKATGGVTDRYTFPPQDLDIDEGDGLYLKDTSSWGTVEAVDRVARTVDVSKGKKSAEKAHPSAAFHFLGIRADNIQASVVEFAEDVIAKGLEHSDSRRDLLLVRPPRLRSGVFERKAGESGATCAARIAPALDRTVLAIQGPPGSGKTYTGARMICELFRVGKRVGVTGPSHAVIRNLLEAVSREAAELKLTVRLGRRVSDKTEESPAIIEFEGSGKKANEKALKALVAGEVDVLGGTAWLWADSQMKGSVEVLFVDEAGQVSLANVLGAAPAGASIVLLGDPQQLDQVQKATHPAGVDSSGLAHMMGGAKTMPADRGIFLDRTWRMAPAIAGFTSSIFYEGRLQSQEGLDTQRLAGAPPFEGAGLWTVAVQHEGNSSSSDEEVQTIRQLVKRLLAPGSKWINSKGEPQDMTTKDILVVAPYNAQVRRLREVVDVSVGTVDKFQGQEAPVVIYSMTTSAPAEAPHGMEFLYNLSRLNVATSRARCAVIVVASPLLFEPECKTPRQMQLANALCRYREMAHG